MKTNTINKMRSGWKRFALGLAGAALMTGSAQAGTWTRYAWTNDADSGITGTAADYTVAVNTGNANVAGASGAVTVNGITFQAHATSGTNFSMAGGFTSTGRAAINLTGSSLTLAQNFLYNGSPRLFDRAEIFFPSMQESNRKKTTPDIMIKASVKAAADETRYESLFALFVKEELLQKITEAQNEAVWKKLQAYLKPVFIAGTSKPWAPQKSELQYGESLQYFFPSVVLANGDKFVFREGYEDWKQLL